MGTSFGRNRLERLLAPSEEHIPNKRPPREVDDDLVMLETPAALDGAEVPDDAEMAVTHPRQMAVLEVPHAISMHQLPIPSILDAAESDPSGRRGIMAPAYLPSAPATFDGARSFSHPNTDRPSSAGDAARSDATNDSNDGPSAVRSSRRAWS